MKGNETKFWRVHGLRNLELMSSSRQVRSLPRRILERFDISIIERGAARIKYRGNTYLASRGDVVVINPGEAYSMQPVKEDGWAFRAFYPTANDVADAASDAMARRIPAPAFSRPVLEDRYLAELISQLHRFLERPDLALARQSYSIWAAGQLVTRHADGGAQLRKLTRADDAVQRVRDYIHDNFSRNLTLDELAQVATLSPFHLVHLFSKQMGLPPHAYLNQVRVNRARDLLVQGRPVADVAQETGFVDQSHFHRHFKRLTGITPGQFA